jgi:hypothetical protein
VLVVILLLLFLGDLRASIIVALALPMAALLTFIFMRAIGLTANLMSLGGLAIAVGILVDGAVVVVENVVERLSDPKHRRMGKLHAIFIAASEVAVPVASGLLIIALVFLPLLTLEGLGGQIVRPRRAHHRAGLAVCAGALAHAGAGARLFRAETSGWTSRTLADATNGAAPRPRARLGVRQSPHCQPDSRRRPALGRGCLCRNGQDLPAHHG